LKVDLPGGNLFAQLGVQVLFFKAAGLMSASPPRYEQALESYRQAEAKLHQSLAEKGDPKQADWTNGGIILFYLLEAMRMCGYCQERLGRRQDALKTYAEAVRFAEKLDAEVRKNTTLAFVGQAMLDIYQALAMKQEYHATQHKMTALLGEDWQNSLPKAAA
jgi:tetratricopeptide (TPR) repeat protein